LEALPSYIEIVRSYDEVDKRTGGQVL
jgi:hypothetical protein